MTFEAGKHDIEEWLTLEEEGMLAKVCNVIDEDGLLIGHYKTRISMLPIGVLSPIGKPSLSAASLFRSFTYDVDGNVVASLPQIKEWTQACEDAAQGSIPNEPPNTGLPAGLKVAVSEYQYGLAQSVPAGASVIVAQKQLLPDEAIYLRHVSISGENRSRFRVDVNGSPLQSKRLWWMHFNDDFWFNTADGGILYNNEELIRIVVTNGGDDVADFETSIGFVLK